MEQNQLDQKIADLQNDENQKVIPEPNNDQNPNSDHKNGESDSPISENVENQANLQSKQEDQNLNQETIPENPQEELMPPKLKKKKFVQDEYSTRQSVIDLIERIQKAVLEDNELIGLAKPGLLNSSFQTRFIADH